MISYFIPLILLAILAFLENLNKLNLNIKNKYLYSFVFFFLIFFVGFRSSIGCDWDSYEYYFNNIRSKDLSYIFKNQDEFFDLGYSILAKLISYKFDNNMLIFVYAILFITPLFYFCANIKRTYLSLMISYPYFIVVVGMGPLRQAASIAFLMLTFVFIEKRKNNLIYFSSFLSMLFHQSAIGINILIISKFNSFLKKKRKKLFSYFFYFFVTLIVLYNSPIIFNKLYIYINRAGNNGINPAKGVIFVWLINFLPSIVFLLNYSKFNFQISLKVFLKMFSFLSIGIFPILFINPVISYRLILYFLPFSIYITSYIPEIELFKIQRTTIFYCLMLLSFLSLFIWLKYAYHAYCWLPYQNILLF